MKRLGTGAPVGHKPPTRRVTGGTINPALDTIANATPMPKRPGPTGTIQTKPLRVTGGVGQPRVNTPNTGTAGARSGVGRLGAAHRGVGRPRFSNK